VGGARGEFGEEVLAERIKKSELLVIAWRDGDAGEDEGVSVVLLGWKND
jgi:hypothetical protein